MTEPLYGPSGDVEGLLTAIRRNIEEAWWTSCQVWTREGQRCETPLDWVVYRAKGDEGRITVALERCSARDAHASWTDPGIMPEIVADFLVHTIHEAGEIRATPLRKAVEAEPGMWKYNTPAFEILYQRTDIECVPIPPGNGKLWRSLRT